MTAPPAARFLADEIAHCPVMVACLDGRDHPCARVARAQWKDVSESDRIARWPREHHTPEPWVGDIENARLLFVGPNPAGDVRRREPPPLRSSSFELPPELAAVDVEAHPSLRRPFTAPKPYWSGDEIFDRYRWMFKLWVDERLRLRVPPGMAPGRTSKYWSAVHAQASALLDSDVIPGEDYAVTEVVHCKSPSVSDGVAQAVAPCTDLYLHRVLTLSPARLVIVYGDEARNAIRLRYAYPDEGVFPKRPVEVAGVTRRFAFLGHPSRRAPGRPKRLEEPALSDARAWLLVEDDPARR